MRSARLLLLLAALSALTATPPPASASGRSETVAAPACAVPGDCRLREAAAPAGIRVGLATAGRGPVQEGVIAAEADVVVNHQFSWVGIEPERGVYDFTKADAEYAFATDHHLFQIGMHFAWDQALVDDLPSWVTSITDPDELRTVLRHRAEVIFERYPNLQMIDVINEPFATVGSTLFHNHFYDVLGPDYIDQLFSIVEAVAPPTVKLIVNEGGVEYLPAKADALVALAQHLQANGHRIDGVGFQTHLAMGEPDWQHLYDAMKRVSDLGMGAHITELDVPVSPKILHRDEVQSERYRRAAAVCLAVPSCTIFDVWGVSDEPSWYENDLYPGLDPLLFDDDFHPKPSYFALRTALEQGRPTDPGPPAFLRDRRVRDTSGAASATYPLACRATGTIRRAGYGELADVTALYLGGNALDLPVAARLVWSRATDGSGRAIHRAHLVFDLQAVADRYLEETARPAIGLGGHPDLVSTVWMRLTGSNVDVSFEPPGAAASGSANAVLATDLRADTRRPVDPAAVDLRWTSDLSSLGDGATAVVDPPTITMDVRVELGVVFHGSDVSGTASLPMTCGVRGEWRELATQVALDGSTTTSASAVASPAPSPADAVPGNATYTG